MTIVIHTIQGVRRVMNQMRTAGKTIGYVPTMGYLHEGHLALVEQAKREGDIVVMSIFVNPAQFGPNEDFDEYPRDLDRDVALAKEHKVDYIFAPTVEEMYPTEQTIQIIPGAIAKKMCGASRPTHFDGVLKVILKLFNIVQPDYAYFGLKDAQQVAIIETFVHDFNIDVAIRRVPIVREEDGLAKSSRNVNLTEEERQKAPKIYEILREGRARLARGTRLEEVQAYIEEALVKETGGVVDYVSILHYPSLTEPRLGEEMIIACAVQFSKTRLIDNVIVGGICNVPQYAE